MLATSEVKMSGNGKKKKGVTQRKFHAVVVRNNGKEIKKSVLDVQSVFSLLVAVAV